MSWNCSKCGARNPDTLIECRKRNCKTYSKEGIKKVCAFIGILKSKGYL